jgi:hypothetical protein
LFYLILFVKVLIPFGSNLVLAGLEGLEPPTPGFGDRCSTIGATALQTYLVSLWFVCFLHHLQYFLTSILSGSFVLFFIVL